MKKRAIISVYNKTGLIEFAKQLVENFNYEIISTGGTKKALENAGIPTIQVKEVTSFPEILDGRVKTLHPKIHGGILADTTNPEHVDTAKAHDITFIDLVVVNLYPFSEVAKNPNASIEDLIENIDIGGPAMIRSASKNHKCVSVVCDPDDYNKIIDEMANNNGATSFKTRQNLALKAFKHTYEYDCTIHKTLSEKFNPELLQESYNLDLVKVQDLRYGENPHQKAALYRCSKDVNNELPMKVLQGKELSYNNLVDLTSAVKIIDEFSEKPAACIIKHNNPCGVALGETILEAYNKALDADPISAFGGIVGLNRPVEKDLASLLSNIFLELIVAPSFSNEAKEILSAKKNLRLVELESSKGLLHNLMLKQVVGGVLIQSSDDKMVSKDDLKIVTEKKPPDNELNELMFAWKICKHVNSNAIVVTKDFKTLGIGCGQTSRIASMEIALKQACDQAKDAVIASDGFFPAIDNIEAAAQSRISAIIQPGGSIKDNDVIETCNKLGVAMVTTGFRHFKH